MIYLNERREPINILHAQGESLNQHIDVVKEIVQYSQNLECPEELTIISIWTDPSKSLIKEQMDKNGIPIINAYIPREGKWSNPYKLECFVEALKTVKTKYVLMVDGYDVVVISFDDIIEKFDKCGYELLFNATKTCHPRVEVDYVMHREQLGNYKYLNAGCCMGLTSRAREFYNTCLKYLNIDNPFNSEQFLVRHAFDECKDKVFFDYQCNIFQSLGKSSIEYIGKGRCSIK